MPDSAFAETERQFSSLLLEASGAFPIRLSRFFLPGIRRSDEVRLILEASYQNLPKLFGGRFDALIVTGTEPLAPDLQSEPYWPALVEVLGWAERSVFSVVLSCLAAHGALVLEGGAREHLTTKCSGVFAHRVTKPHPLTEGLGDYVVMPHSRLNDVPLAVVEALGYRDLLPSSEVSWTLAARQRGTCVTVLVQGHPEYAGTSLLREFRRDFQRFLDKTRPTAPNIPTGYLDDPELNMVRSFVEQAQCRADGQPTGSFPFDEAAAGLRATWRASAVQLYSNWLRLVACSRT